MKEFIDENGMYYRTNDFRSDHLTLVFVHGLTGSSSAWVDYEKRFAETYNMLTFDLRGHGKSKKFNTFEDYTITQFARDLKDLTQQLKIEKFILISHSYGTIIALEYLREYPGTVVSAIFLSPVYRLKKRRWSNLVFGLTNSYSTIISRVPFRPKIGSHLDYSLYKNSGDWNLPRMYADTTNTSVRIFMYCLRQAYLYHHERFWEQLALPTLIVHGKKDTISPVESAVTISRMVKNSRLVILEHGNHIIVLNNFKEVSDAIEEFLSR